MDQPMRDFTDLLLRRGVPEPVIGEATGISAWFLAEMGRNIALEHETSAMGARLLDTATDPGAAATRTRLQPLEHGGCRMNTTAAAASTRATAASTRATGA